MTKSQRQSPTSLRLSTWAPVLCALWAFPGTSAFAAEAMSRGQQLVEIHCIRCHDAPQPHDLSKDVWPKRLASMGMYLGFKGDELPDIVSV